jgi:hypothetical protein
MLENFGKQSSDPMIKVLILAPAIALIGIVLPWRDVLKMSPDELMGMVPADRFKGMEDWLGEWDWPFEQFWADSGGFRGTCARFRHMMLIGLALQKEMKKKTISPKEAAHILNKILLQVWFSAWIPLECVWCRLSHRIPRMAALCAFRSHYQLTLAAFTACSSDNTHISATHLYQIL